MQLLHEKQQKGGRTMYRLQNELAETTVNSIRLSGNKWRICPVFSSKDDCVRSCWPCVCLGLKFQGAACLQRIERLFFCLSASLWYGFSAKNGIKKRKKPKVCGLFTEIYLLFVLKKNLYEHNCGNFRLPWFCDLVKGMVTDYVWNTPDGWTATDRDTARNRREVY